MNLLYLYKPFLYFYITFRYSFWLVAVIMFLYFYLLVPTVDLFCLEASYSALRSFLSFTPFIFLCSSPLSYLFFFIFFVGGQDVTFITSVTSCLFVNVTCERCFFRIIPIPIFCFENSEFINFNPAFYDFFLCPNTTMSLFTSVK